MAESRDPAELLWGWQEWRRAVGPPSRIMYPAVVALMNQGARSNGYYDIGACWREELETPNLEHVVDELYRQVEPLYTLLHAVVRFRLVQFYGEETVPPTGPIPAHLLGNTEPVTLQRIGKINNVKKNWIFRFIFSCGVRS
jgi:hypothetical protein